MSSMARRIHCRFLRNPRCCREPLLVRWLGLGASPHAWSEPAEMSPAPGAKRWDCLLLWVGDRYPRVAPHLDARTGPPTTIEIPDNVTASLLPGARLQSLFSKLVSQPTERREGGPHFVLCPETAGAPRDRIEQVRGVVSDVVF